MATKGTSGQRGFTLIELLVVMAILIMVSVAIPSALNRALPGRRVAAATERLVAAIREAQAESAVTGRSARIEVPPLAASTHVTLADPAGRPMSAAFVFSDGSTSAARFEIADGVHRNVVTVSGLTGRVHTERAR